MTHNEAELWLDKIRYNPVLREEALGRVAALKIELERISTDSNGNTIIPGICES